MKLFIVKDYIRLAKELERYDGKRCLWVIDNLSLCTAAHDQYPLFRAIIEDLGYRPDPLSDCFIKGL